MERRDVLKLAGAAATAAALGRAAARPAEAPIEVAMLVYPGFTALDLVGPQTVLSSLAMKGHPLPKLVWKTKDPVPTDTGFAVTPTATFADVPEDVGVLFVPGGTAGTLKVMEDPEVVAFLADRGRRAKWVTSVCTGSLVLGAAGLLKGHQATSHWLTRDLLPAFGAEPVNARVVEDRTRVTGAGVTAGIDFGLRLLAKLGTEEWARNMALNLEYAPEPPVRCGTPDQAGPEVTGRVRKAYAAFLPAARKAADRAAQRLG